MTLDGPVRGILEVDDTEEYVSTKVGFFVGLPQLQLSETYLEIMGLFELLKLLVSVSITDLLDLCCNTSCLN